MHRVCFISTAVLLAAGEVLAQPIPPQQFPQQPSQPLPSQPFPQAPAQQPQPPNPNAPDPPGQYVGQWQCQYASRGWTDRSNTWMFTFALWLNADSSFQAQGTYYAEIIGYNEPFQARGQWQTVPGGLTGSAPAQLPNRVMQLFLGLKNSGPGSLTANFQNQIGQIVVACRR